MTRVSMSPGRDLSRPLVEIPPEAPRSVRVGLVAMRWYLVAVFGLGLLCGVLWLLLWIFSL